MEKIVHVPHTQLVMAFIATCIESTARLLNTSYKDVYERMKHVQLIENYILPGYEPLHSESRENIAKGIADCLTKWEKKHEY